MHTIHQRLRVPLEGLGSSVPEWATEPLSLLILHPLSSDPGAVKDQLTKMASTYAVKSAGACVVLRGGV